MQDFMQCLPFPEYAHPGGSLNVANYLSQDLVKPDLGPKSYIATGRYHLSSPFLSHAPFSSPGMCCSCDHLVLSVQPKAVSSFGT